MIERYVEMQRQRIDEYLAHYLKQERELLTEKLFDAMEHALAGGKRLRPILLLTVGEALQDEPEKFLPAAVAIECFHVYSLIHDDLPAMDNSDLRHGRLATHKKFDEATAILAGDTLIPLGYQLLAEEQARHSPAKNILALIQTVSRVLGTEGLTGGQLLDLSYDRGDQPSVITMYERKTAALIALATSAPAILLKSNETKRLALQRFGQTLGLAYQLIDDILDAEEEPEKPTLARLWGIEQTRARAQQLTLEATDAIKPLRAPRLAELTRFLLDRKY
jgi:geranylgeranyl pyrophosphate synthase